MVIMERFLIEMNRLGMEKFLMDSVVIDVTVHYYFIIPYYCHYYH